MEYKSPGDYVSVDDFYKVYAYSCLYKSLEHVPITSLTISFVESHHPQKLIEHLENERGYRVEETSSGIYTVSGDILPIQVIDSRKLPMEENLWLKCLSDELDQLKVRQVSAEIVRHGKAARIAAYLNVIAKANTKAIQEAIRMDDTLTLEKVFEEVGWIAKWEARGEARGRVEGEERKALAIAQNLIKMGLPAETIVSALAFQI